MAATVDLEHIATRLALEDLNVAFTRHLDHGDVDALVDLFTDDALYTHGERRSEGKAAIEALFRRRTAGGPRTSRHICSGLMLEILDASNARGTSVCLSFAADGVPPLPATPFLVADFEDHYRRGGDGRWRFAARHIERIFAAASNSGPIGHDRA
jgi:ketosteroid isomerase-like protein